jgi:hypothetical protein
VSTLKIAPGLSLDADYVGGGTFALLAKKGAGKTYTGRVMAEEFWQAKAPFVVLDPMDAWWGLRAGADGKGEGIPVAIFGGPHGDAPLERTSGKLMADLVVDEGLSMVLSLKHFGSRSAERQFALDFLERLYRRNSELVHLLIDEADLFAPQKPYAGDAPLLGVTENIVRRGRNSGIGITLISQRPAVLNKDVLTQADGLCVMRMLGPQDRNAIDDWVGEHGDTNLGKEVNGSLPDLATGECWWWVPELGVLKRVKVRQSRTFDSSPTRKRGSQGREPKSFADVDMGAIEAKMADTIERAKADDPKELRKQPAELKRELEKRPTEVETKVETVTERVEVPVLNGELEDLERLIGALRGAAEPIGRAAEEVRVGAEAIADAVMTIRPHAGRQVQPPEKGREAAARPARPVGTREPAVAARAPAAEGDVQLKAGARRMLKMLARLHPEPLTRVQLGTLADITPTSGTFSDYINALKRVGYVDEERGVAFLTDAGLEEAADEVGGQVPSPEELAAMWSRKFKLGARRMLDELMRAYPDGLTRDDLAERTEITRSSGTFSDYINALKRNKVADEHGGLVYAGEALFLGARV